jgi:FtsH-binding integral membrane protein
MVIFILFIQQLLTCIAVILAVIFIIATVSDMQAIKSMCRPYQQLALGVSLSCIFSSLSYLGITSVF